MSYCVMSGCSNRSTKKRKNVEQLEIEKRVKVSFHKFPKDKVKCSLWLEAIGLNNWDPPKNSAICSLHFNEKDFDKTSPSVRRLKCDAIPNEKKYDVFSNACSNIVQNLVETNECFNESTNEEPSTSSTVINVPLHFIAKKANVDKINKTINDQITPFSNEKNIGQNTKLSSPKRKMVDAATYMSPERIFNSPTKQKMREAHAAEIRKMRLKINRISNNLNYNKRRVEYLSSILKNLKRKNVLSETNTEIIQEFDIEIGSAVRRIIKKRRKCLGEKGYDVNIRRFALTLHNYSPRAYSYVRSKFGNALPHVKTLSKWYITSR